MNLAWATIVFIQILSFLFMALCLLRTFSYKRRNKFVETKYSLLFTFMRLDHAIIIYIFFTVFYAVSSVLLVYYLASI
jgi:hypothetical protein